MNARGDIVCVVYPLGDAVGSCAMCSTKGKARSEGTMVLIIVVIMALIIIRVPRFVRLEIVPIPVISLVWVILIIIIRTVCEVVLP